MPRIKVAIYREEDGGSLLQEIDRAVERKKKYESDPKRHTWEEK